MYLEFSENNFHKNDQTLAIEKVVSFGLRTISPFHLLQKKEKKGILPYEKTKGFWKISKYVGFYVKTVHRVLQTVLSLMSNYWGKITFTRSTGVCEVLKYQ